MPSVSHRGQGNNYSVSPPAATGLVNVKDAAFGALGDGASDDRTAVRAAIAYASAQNMKGVYFPSGTFMLSEDPAAGSTGFGTACAIDFSGYADLTLQGVGRGTVLKMKDPGPPRTGDFYLLRIRNCSNITIRDMVLDGNFVPPSTGWDEQVHLVRIGTGTAVGGTVTGTRFFNVQFQNVRGDGCQIIGQDGGGEVNDVLFDQCRWYQCHRAALGCQRGGHYVQCTNFYMEGSNDQEIDFEPSGSGAPSYFKFAHGYIIHNDGSGPIAVTLTGLQQSDPHSDSVFTDVTVINGNVEGLDVRRLKMTDCTIVGWADAVDTQDTLVFNRGCESVDLTGTTVIRPAAAGPGVVCNFAAVTDSALRVPYKMTVRGGHFHQYTAGNIINATTVDDYVVDGATVANYVSGAGGHYGIFIRSASQATEGVQITGCKVLGAEGSGTLAAGIRVAAGGFNIGQTVTVGNRIEGCTVDIQLIGSTGHSTYPVCSLNTGKSTTTIVAETYYVVWGNYPGVMGIVGAGSPEGAVTAPVGSAYYRNDNANALYIKQTGTGNTGWVLK